MNLELEQATAAVDSYNLQLSKQQQSQQLATNKFKLNNNNNNNKVLPHAKLQLTGLKNHYSMNERVELHCLSDYSRPLGSIGWFANGRLVSFTSLVEVAS